MGDVLVWVVQAAVAAVFLFSAATKGTWSKQRLVASGQTGVAPVLTPVAACGLGLVMVGAGAVHLRLGEPRTALGNLAILAGCAVVAAARFAELP